MAELLKFLSVGGDIGIWLLVLLAWRTHDRLLHIELSFKGHTDMDEAEFKRIHHRLDSIEQQ